MSFRLTQSKYSEDSCEHYIWHISYYRDGANTHDEYQSTEVPDQLNHKNEPEDHSVLPGSLQIQSFVSQLSYTAYF